MSLSYYPDKSQQFASFRPTTFSTLQALHRQNEYTLLLFSGCAETLAQHQKLGRQRQKLEC